jgi:hypothetical protein
VINLMTAKALGLDATRPAVRAIGAERRELHVTLVTAQHRDLLARAASQMRTLLFHCSAVMIREPLGLKLANFTLPPCLRQGPTWHHPFDKATGIDAGRIGAVNNWKVGA